MLGRKLVSALVVLASLVVGAAGFAGYIYWRDSRPMALAERALAAGRLPDALLLLRTATRDDPRNAPAYMMLAQVHSRLGDLVSAERDLKRARALGADRWEVMGQLGPFYLADRRYQEVLTEIPATGPDAQTAARNLAMRSRAFTGMNDLGAATEALEAARKLDPALSGVRLAAARIAMARAETGQAVAELDAALQADPSNLEALLLRSQIYMSSGSMGDALGLLDRAVAAAPGYLGPLLQRAGLLLAMGRDADARRDLDAVRRSQPHNAAAVYLDGVLATHEHRFAEASERFGQLGPTAARFPRAAYFQAQAALEQNLTSTAVELAARYAAQFPGDPEGVRLLARAQTADRKPAQAAAALADAVRRGIDDAQTLTMLGAARVAVGDLDGAEKAYLQAQAKAPGSALVEAQLIELRVRRGEPDRAAATVQQASAAGPGNATLLQAAAVAQIAAGELPAAADTLAELRRLTGETESTGVLAGMLALARLDAEGAVTAFAATLRAFPDSTLAALDLARALTAAGRREEARTTLAELLAKDPRNIAALGSFVQFEVQAGKFEAALRALETARAALPTDDGVLLMLADVLVRNGDPGRALATILRSRGPERRTPALLAAMARAQAAQGQPAEAERSYRAAQDADPSPWIPLALADLQRATGNLPAARATLDAAIHANPADAELLARRVNIEIAASGLDAGLATAAGLRKDTAQMPAAALLAGDALMGANRPAEAARAFQQEWQATPTPVLAIRLAQAQVAANDDASASRALQTVPGNVDGAVLAAGIAIRAKHWPDAASSLELALRGRPDHPGLLNNLAVAYQQMNDPRARATARRAYLVAPTPDAADTLGWILVKEGAAGEGIPILRQALAGRPADPTIAYHLAAGLASAGQTAEAARLAKTALAADLPLDDRAAAAALLAPNTVSR